MTASVLHAALVTFDVDWAPDWTVSLCADACAKAGVSATFFATHASPVITELAADDRFEVGIHPNFLPGSSHGVTTLEVLRHCLEFVPGARSMRTHALVQSSPILEAVGAHAPEITSDVSLFLPFHSHLQPVDCYVGDPLRRLVRLPYCWEDDVSPIWPGWSWDSPLIVPPGLAVFDFHPILVALNASSVATYRDLKTALGGRPLSGVSPAEVASVAYRGAGVRTFLDRLLDQLKGAKAVTASAVTGEWLRLWPQPPVSF